MSRRKRWVGPPPGSQPNREPGEIIELSSDDEKGGEPPLPPRVELRPCGPRLEIIELHPTPLRPEPPPFDRARALAGLQAAFAELTDDELEVARVRMLGVAYADVAEELDRDDDEVERLWKRARRKLGTALYASRTVSATGTTAAISPEPGSGKATPPATAGDDHA
jgi:DNA-directed RNA polymerase specialized sigma24 family protein